MSILVFLFLFTLQTKRRYVLLDSRANIVSTPKDYIVGAESPPYRVPFPSPKEEDMPYDEDWPEDSPYIPQY